ncbi:MAG TPA: sulfotransferase [Gammaproteobacteria bacterium]|nr:sulfotransferase [Gammaproteobacteria bacterium]
MKVFCIGFNKTGTTSMHGLFRGMGLRSYHGQYSILANAGDFNAPLFAQYDCFSDGEAHDFAALDRAFPGSKFILLTRSLEGWLLSRMKHIYIRRSKGKDGPMRREFESDPERALQDWVRRRLEYHERVREYFTGRPDDFREVNICDRPDQERLAEELRAFLGIDSGGASRLPRNNVSRNRPPRTPRTLLRLLAGRKVRPDFRSDELKARVRQALQEVGIPEELWISDQ